MTKEFEAIISWGGTPAATCACGRKHYVGSGENMEDGELALLQAKHIANPDRYIPDHQNSSISVGTLNGVTAVWECPCGYFERMEEFLWEGRERIIAYYVARTAREQTEANANSSLLSKLA